MENAGEDKEKEEEASRQVFTHPGSTEAATRWR